jgi:hypothetical protein
LERLFGCRVDLVLQDAITIPSRRIQTWALTATPGAG